MSSGYLISNIEYPATMYEPILPEVNGVYHEDREVNLTGTAGDSQMYRTYNAQFQPASATWTLQTPGVSNAFATVQNPDGSIHYYKLNTTTGLWEGSDNNSVYNAVDYGLSLTDPSGGVNNTAALNNAVADIITAGGGTLFIPAGSFKLNGAVTINLSSTTVGVIIAGVSGQTELGQ